MRTMWKVITAALGLVVVGVVVYGVALVAGEPLRSGLVVTAGWGSGPDEVGVMRWENEPWQGPGTFTTDGTRFYVADEVNHRLKVYDSGRWLEPIPLPSQLQHVKELRLSSGCLFVYGIFEDGPPDGDLGVIDLKSGRLSRLGLSSDAPGFNPPYTLRAKPGGGIVVRRTGSDLDPRQGPIVATLDAKGNLISTDTEKAAFGGDFIWCGREPGSLAEQLCIYKRNSDGVDGAQVNVPGSPGAMGIYINWDNSRVVVLSKPRELFGQKAYYINVYDQTKGSWHPHLVSIAVENEIAPSFSTGDMLQYVNGVLYEMVYTTDGVVINQYVLP